MSDWLEIGEIVAAQGLKGEVRVLPDSDFPERFEQPGQRWLLYPGTPDPQPIELLRGRHVGGKGQLYILCLAGVESREQAEALRGCKLLVPASSRPVLQAEEFHVLDLIGLEVFHQGTQVAIGTIVDIIPAGNDLLQVKLHQPTSVEQPMVLIPFVNAIVPVVDVLQGRVEITPPAGLID